MTIYPVSGIRIFPEHNFVTTIGKKQTMGRRSRVRDQSVVWKLQRLSR
jgi:hypothetical protein